MPEPTAAPMRFHGFYNIKINHMIPFAMKGIFGTLTNFIVSSVFYDSKACNPPQVWEFQGNQYRMKDTVEWSTVPDSLGPLTEFGLKGEFDSEGEHFQAFVSLIAGIDVQAGSNAGM